MAEQEFEYYVLHHFISGTKSPESILKHLEVINLYMLKLNTAFDYKLYQNWCIEHKVSYAAEYKPMKLFTVYIRWMDVTHMNQWDVSVLPASEKDKETPFKMVYLSTVTKNWQGIIRAHSFQHANEQAWACLREGLLDPENP